MRIYHVATLSPERVFVFQKGVLVAAGCLDDLNFIDDGDDDHDSIDVYLHPDAVPEFKDRFFLLLIAARKRRALH